MNYGAEHKKLGSMGLVFVLFSVFGLIAGIHLISNALMLASITMLGMIMLWVRLYPSVRYFLTIKWVRIPLDLTASVLIPLKVSNTLTGMAASMFAGIMITLFLEFEAIRIRGGFQKLWNRGT